MASVIFPASALQAGRAFPVTAGEPGPGQGPTAAEPCKSAAAGTVRSSASHVGPQLQTGRSLLGAEMDLGFKLMGRRSGNDTQRRSCQGPGPSAHTAAWRPGAPGQGCRNNNTVRVFTRDAQGLTGLRSPCTPHLKAHDVCSPQGRNPPGRLLPNSQRGCDGGCTRLVGGGQHPSAPSTPQIPTHPVPQTRGL